MISIEVLEKLLQYINSIDETTVEKTVKENPTECELILSCLACLQEETGEVASEVRKLTAMSFNKEKVESFSQDMLNEELVDIIITVLLLTKRVGTDSLDEAIIKKIEKNNKRGY